MSVVVDPWIKSRQRVADHGEVFTPDRLVNDMLDLVKADTERIEARVLEPACGSGNFLVPVLRRKFATIQARYGKSDFERRHQALFALMAIYGLELLADNAAECRANLLAEFVAFIGIDADKDWRRAAQHVLDTNIIQGDALDMTDAAGAPITFAEWAYVGAGRYKRRDFRLGNIAQRAAFDRTEHERPETHPIFTPVKDYPPATLHELAR